MVSSEEESDVKPGDTVEWDVDMEIQLFYAMANHKPVGINKHFHMACIWEKLSNSITKEISTQDIWKHLESLYDLSMLDDTERIPFPNHEMNFSLPDSEFGSLMKQKCRDIILPDDSEGTWVDVTNVCLHVTKKLVFILELHLDRRSASPLPSTPRSGSKGLASKDNTPKGSDPFINKLSSTKLAWKSQQSNINLI